MVGVHPNNDGGILPIPTETALAYEQSNKKSEVELGRSTL
jgi:hypothetical protein